jgi:hypothetical protein
MGTQAAYDWPRHNLVRVRSGQGIVQLPDGYPYEPGDIVALNDEEFSNLNVALLGTVLDLVGGTIPLPGSADLFIVQVALDLASVVNGPVTSIIPGVPPSIPSGGSIDMPGFDGDILSWRFLTTEVGTGAAATITFNLEIGATNVGSPDATLVLPLANTSSVGEITTGSDPTTGDNAFLAGQAIEVEAAAVTAFTAGAGVLEILVQAT